MARQNNYDGMDSNFTAALQKLIDASGGRIWINSGYRSVEKQTQLYAQAQQKYGNNARKWVAPPGKSNHNHGIAADLGGDLKLAHQLAPMFGLVFPMSWEPWHIEPPWARGKRGADYKSSQTVPPDGVTAGDDPHKRLDHQLYVFNQLIMGRDPSELAGEFGSTEPFSDELAGPDGTGAGGAGRVSPRQLYQALRGAGADPVHAAALVAIAGRESGYDLSAYNGNEDTGDDSLGLFQINLMNGGWTSFLQDHGISDPRKELHTIDGSVRAAVAILQNSGLHPWGGYKGMPWSYNTEKFWNSAVAASGGEVTIDDLRGLDG